jgi:hypothetical protein
MQMAVHWVSLDDYWVVCHFKSNSKESSSITTQISWNKVSITSSTEQQVASSAWKSTGGNAKHIQTKKLTLFYFQHIVYNQKFGLIQALESKIGYFSGNYLFQPVGSIGRAAISSFGWKKYWKWHRGENTCHLEALLQLQPVGSDPPLLVAGHHPHDEPRLPPELHELAHPAVDRSSPLTRTNTLDGSSLQCEQEELN